MFIGLSLNNSSVAEIMTIMGLFGALTAYMAWTVYQSFRFRLELNEIGGVFYGVGKTIQFEWSAFTNLEYDDRHDEGSSRYQLCLRLGEITVTRGFWLPSIYLFPITSSDNLIPLSVVYHHQSLWSRSRKTELPTYVEYRSHLQYFLNTQLGQDIIEYAPHALKDVMLNINPIYA